MIFDGTDCICKPGYFLNTNDYTCDFCGLTEGCKTC
jgi:hypothetical protein